MCISDGTWRQYVTVPATNVFAMPDAMTYEEGAAIPVNYITAYHMLFDMGGLRPGKSVLVHMVAGGEHFLSVMLKMAICNHQANCTFDFEA